MASYFTETFLADGGISGAWDLIWKFFATSGWFMVPILICWLVAMFIVGFKFLELRRNILMPEDLVRRLENLDATPGHRRQQELEKALRGDSSLLGKICRAAVFSRHSSKEDAAKSTEALAREELSKLERGIPVLEVIFTTAPMLGLVGTASGLVVIFANFSGKAQTAEQSARIAAGISEALYTTIGGLVVAVPTYFFQSFFSRKLEAIALRMSFLLTNLLNALYAAPQQIPRDILPGDLEIENEPLEDEPELFPSS